MNSLLPTVATSFFDPDIPGSQAAAINKLLNRLGLIDQLDQSVSNILIKPNLSLEGDALSEHLTTLVELVRALSRFGAKVNVGDSPPNNDLKTTKFWQKIGLVEIATKHGFDLVNFEEEKCGPVALYQSVYYLPECALNSEFLINLTCVKPNSSGNYSGAISNMAGVLPGKHHYRELTTAGKTERTNLLVDLLALLKPALNLVVVPACYLDSETYSGGKPGEALMLGSADAVAIDALLGFSANGIEAENELVVSACQAGLGIGWPEAIILKETAPVLKKITVNKRVTYQRATIWLQNSIGRLVNGDTSFLPFINRRLCDSCGNCIDRCPSRALHYGLDLNGRKTVEIKQVVCLCCHLCRESCPQDAISLECEQQPADITQIGAESATI